MAKKWNKGPGCTKRRPFSERLWEKVEKIDSGCWLWTAALNKNGYGVIGRGDRRENILAHRATYEDTYGPMEIGKELDHLCRNSACVNPAHLEPVTHAENMRRGRWLNQANSKKTHCPRGHPYAGYNLYISTNDSHPNGFRHCRTCKREQKLRVKEDQHAYHADRQQ